MFISHKVEIEPTATQKKVFEDYFNYSRYIYNNALEIWNKQYEMWEQGKLDKRPTQSSVIKVLRSWNVEDWEKEISNSMVLETSVMNLGMAFKMFLKGITKSHPRFRNKRDSRRSFWYFRKNDHCFRIEGEKKDKIYLQAFSHKYGLIKMKEPIRFKKFDLREVRISRRADKYFASLVLDVNIKASKEKLIEKRRNSSSIGIDLGVKKFATIVSDKEKVIIVDSIYEKKLKKIFFKISKMKSILDKKRLSRPNEEPSKRYLRLRNKIGRLHLKASNIEHDFLHKLTFKLCTKFKNICIEDLNVGQMLKKNKGRNLADRIGKSLFGTFRNLMEYKSEIYDCNLVIVPRFYASSQICSHCGNQLVGKEKLKLSQREYVCPKCGFTEDRDINAALNLLKYAVEASEHPERFEDSKR